MNYNLRSSVKLTHLPTGITAIGYDLKCGFAGQRDAEKRALSLLKAKITKWGEGEGEVKRIRSWHLKPLLGLDPFVKDDQTGDNFPFDYNMLNGEIDELLYITP